MILVLGASGFIGGNISVALATNKLKFLAPNRSELNIFSLADVYRYFEKHLITKVIWCVTTYSPSKKIESVTDHLAFNNILSACETFLSDIIYLGSMSEVNHSGKIKNENYFTTVPRTEYGKSKQAISKILYTASEKIKKYNLRLFGVFGDGEAKYRLIPSVVDSVNTSNELKLSDCLHERDFINVKVVADVVVKIVKDSKIPSGLYNIGSGDSIQIRELLLSVVPESHKNLLLFGEQGKRITDTDRQFACIKRSCQVLDLDKILRSHLDVKMYIRSSIQNASV